MKTLKLIIVICIITSVYVDAQNINGYKYVFVGDLKYENGVDIYGISNYVREKLQKEGFVLFNPEYPAQDVVNNECLLLNCLINTSHGNASDFNGYPVSTGAVEIVLKNCENEIVFKGTGTTQYGSPWNIVFQKSVDRALKKMTYSYNPSYNRHSARPLYPVVENTGETEESLRKYFQSDDIHPIEGIYKSLQSENIVYYKLGIKKFDNKFKAILIETEVPIWKTGEVKAIIEPSSIKEIYSIKWYSANKESEETFGSIEDGKLLSIEHVNKQTGEKFQSKFIKIFPAVDENESEDDNSYGASGSGFVLNKVGMLATNAHVVDKAESIEVIFKKENEQLTYQAKVMLKDDINDVAILKIEDELFEGFENIPYRLIKNTEIGEKVFTIGYPLNDILGSNYKVTDGIISSQTGIADDVRFMQISVPIQAGNSGGPLFDNKGNIIGITTAKLNEKAVGSSVENVNYAIKMSYLLNLYRMLPNSEQISKVSQVEGLELKEQVKILKDYVCLIKVYY